MSYYFNKILKDPDFDKGVQQVTEELKKEGFGILSEINVQETLNSKLDVDFKKYKILGACNPKYAYQALQKADKIGVFLPCNVVVEELENGEIEVCIVNPIASMSAVRNNELEDIAVEIKKKLLRVLANLN